MQVTVRTIAAACVTLIALATGSQTADAQALDRILKEKKIRITAEVTSPPFGILDKDNKPTGSEVETARQLAKDLGVELELVQVTGPQRIPALLSDRADLAISSLSITTERAKTVWFASPHGALSIVIGASKKVNIKSAADLAGKKIGMTRATLEEQVVSKVAPPGTNIVYFDEIRPRSRRCSLVRSTPSVARRSSSMSLPSAIPTSRRSSS
jgi:polar amino acid transport system substrate-binding protein